VIDLEMCNVPRADPEELDLDFLVMIALQIGR